MWPICGNSENTHIITIIL